MLPEFGDQPVKLSIVIAISYAGGSGPSSSAMHVCGHSHIQTRSAWRRCLRNPNRRRDERWRRSDAVHSATEAQKLRVAYLPEIGGLRAFAVNAVIINHFSSKLLPSGYLGVDIFFVISGFVITSSLINYQHKTVGDLLLNFNVRRIKRLIPALVFFVFFTSLVLCLFNPNPALVLKTGISSLFGLSNLYLFKLSTD